jgi:peptidoglycan/xylan/chitin deacetylase (PgdA/CDA1 family)
MGNGLFHAREALGHYRLSRYATSESCAILMYHGLSSDPLHLAANELDVRPEACRAEIEFFVRQGYRLALPEDLLDARGGQSASVLVTFDDGYLELFEPLKQLLRRGIPILVSVCPELLETGGVYWWEELLARLSLTRRSPVSMETCGGRTYGRGDGPEALRFCKTLPKDERAELLDAVRKATSDVGDEELRRSSHVHALMGWEELRTLLATGKCGIAAHSLRHDATTRVALAELESDAIECRRRIEERLGVSCVDWVYPFGSEGDFSSATEEVLKSCGYQRTYTSVERLNSPGDSQFGRFRGIGLGGSLWYYARLWETRHRPGRGTDVSAVEGPGR